ncbi:MAG: hypothetical protein RLZZ387_2534, partial [Chloroflexota bacterium]
KELGPIDQLPVPVEKIAEIVLDLNMDWDEFDENILARLNYQDRAIQPNTARRDLFERNPGVYHFTIAHEMYHYLAHVEDDNGQGRLDLAVEPVVLNRARRSIDDPQDRRREFQAQRFAAYLTMPEHLVLPAIAHEDVTNLAVLRRLAVNFGVSVEALKIRLKTLGRLYEAPDGRLYRSMAEGTGQLSLL